MTAGPATAGDCGNPISTTTDLAHVAGAAPGRTIVLVTLSGGDVLAREALAERVIAAVRQAVAPAPPVNRLAAVFAHLSQPPAPVPAAATKFVPALVVEPEPAPVAQSPYDAPFVLAPLHRPAR